MDKLKFKVTEIDTTFQEQLLKLGHKDTVKFVCDCAEHVIHYFNDVYPDDERPRYAISIGRKWILDKVKVDDARKAAFDCHNCARDVRIKSAISVARACGHAVATVHVKSHAIYAVNYALQAVSFIEGARDSDITNERNWQLQHLRSLIT